MKPLVGLTCYSGTGPDWAAHAPDLCLDELYRNYSRSVSGAGGLPVLIPVAEDIDAPALLSRLDALVLTGGPDIVPRLYNEQPRPGLRGMDYERDMMEFQLVREADRAGLPVLGICRGIQVMNAALGGSLYQDLKTEVHGAVNHAPKAPRHVNTHLVRILPGTLLHYIVGAEQIWVNSGHHQALAETAPGLVPAAVADDNIVEAVEKPGHPFFLGVQWHPEGTAARDVHSRRIFKALVSAAGGESEE